MENRNIKRANETLKEIAEMQNDIHDFNAKIDYDIYEIDQALSIGDYKQQQKCVEQIMYKHPDWWQYLNKSGFLCGFIFGNSLAITLSLQKQALQNMKANHEFIENLKRGAKLGLKWRLEDIQDSKIGK